MKNQDWSAGYAIAFFLVFVTFVIFGVLQTDRPLWQDEAALIENFGLPWGAYFKAFPFNDQAAPPFAMITHDLMWQLAGGDVTSMRLLTLAFTAAIFGGVGLAAIRRRDLTMLVALILLMTTQFVVNYAIEIKHYIFELCAALLLLHAAITINPMMRRGVVVLFGLSVAMSLFSFSAMFISVIIFLDIVVLRTTGRIRLLWLAALVGFVLVWGGLYFSVFKPMTFYQLNNYQSAYADNTLLARLQSSSLGLAQPFIRLLFPGYFGIAVALGIVYTVLVRRSTAPAQGINHTVFLPIRLGLGLIAALLFLSLLGLYPLSNGRQLLFTHPPKALATAAIIVLICGLRIGATSPKLIVAILVAAFAAPGTIDSVRSTLSKHYIFQDTAALYSHVQARSDIPVVPDILFAPTLRYYIGQDAAQQLVVLGMLPFDTREIDSKANVIAHLNGDAIEELTYNAWSPLNEGDAYLAYTDYVMRIAVNTGRITFAAAQFRDRHAAFLMQSAASAGCGVSRDFAGRGVRAFDIKCNAQTE